jgi:hypothetical protein
MSLLLLFLDDLVSENRRVTLPDLVFSSCLVLEGGEVGVGGAGGSEAFKNSARDISFSFLFFLGWK